MLWQEEQRLGIKENPAIVVRLWNFLPMKLPDVTVIYNDPLGLLPKSLSPSPLSFHHFAVVILKSPAPIPGRIYRKDKNITCTPMFTPALFTIAKTWTQPKCQLTEEWIKKMWYIHAMEY